MIPTEKTQSLIASAFVQEATLEPLMQRLREYIPESQKNKTLFTQDYLTLMRPFTICRAKGTVALLTPYIQHPFSRKNQTDKTHCCIDALPTPKRVPSLADNLQELNR